MFNSVAARFLIVFLAASKFKGKVSFPVNKGMMRWERKWRGIQWIDVSPHAIILFLGHLAIKFNNFLIALVVVGFVTELAFPLHKRNIIRKDQL